MIKNTQIKLIMITKKDNNGENRQGIVRTADTILDILRNQLVRF